MKFSFTKDAAVILKMSYQESNIHERLTQSLSQIFSQLPYHQQIVIVCVGTDRSTGDALGPLVGSNMSKRQLDNCRLYGTLNEPVHAMNLQEVIHSIYNDFDNPFIVAIDACLGQLTSVGCIQLVNGPVKPGAGVNKELPAIGDIHITGIVNVGGFMEYFVLQNTRLSLVMNMADIISDSFSKALTGRRRHLANHL